MSIIRNTLRNLRHGLKSYSRELFDDRAFFTEIGRISTKATEEWDANPMQWGYFTMKGLICPIFVEYGLVHKRGDMERRLPVFLEEFC